MSTIQPGSIVVADAGSPDSDRAVLWAAEQAYLERRPLTVVTVVPDGPLTASKEAAAAARHWRPGIDVDSVVIEAPVRRTLRNLSSAAHLLVLGSRGRGPVGSAVLGSVSSSVSRNAACPVVVCRPGSVGRVHRGVLVGADGTARSQPVVEFAFRQAALRDLPLTVVHGAGQLSHPAALAVAESVAGYAELYPEVRLSVEPEVDFDEACVGTASERWDLVVVGRASGTDVVERTHTTVAVVPGPVEDPAHEPGTKAPHLAVPRP